MDDSLTRPARAWLIVTVFLSGTCVMVLEMAAARAAAPYFGQSNYIWTNVIGVILAALGSSHALRASGHGADPPQKTDDLSRFPIGTCYPVLRQKGRFACANHL